MDSYFPIHAYSPFMKGIVGCGLEIVHALLTQMALGGGVLLFYFERLRRGGRSKYAGRFNTGSFPAVVSASFILGALTGVAIWFVSIQQSPGRIGSIVGGLHWIWATEWTFFCVEVVAGYAYLRYQDRLSGKDRLTLLALYSVASWLSLFLKSAIGSSPLTSTPVGQSQRLWSVFFHSSFWPSIFSRTIVALAIAGLGACMVIETFVPEDREARQALMGHASRFLAPMLLIPLLSIWFLASSPAVGSFAARWASPSTMICVGITAVASLVLGAVGLSAFWYGKLALNPLAMALLGVSAFLATAGCELLTKTIRRPDTLPQAWFSGSLCQLDRTKERL
jgi:hypothetical protein